MQDKGNLIADWSDVDKETLRDFNTQMTTLQEHRGVTIPSRIRYGSTRIYEIAGLVHAFEMVPPFPPECLIVEIGSLVGKTTIALASLRMHRVVSIDPHDGPWEIAGDLGNRDRRLEWGNTLDRFKENLEVFGVADNVDIVQKYSDDAAADWNYKHKICLHFIDGCHDYEQVKKDFYNFYPFMIGGCLVAFHDYNPLTFPGVIKAVDEIEEKEPMDLLFHLGCMKVFQLR